MKTVQLHEAKVQLSKLIEAVQNGEEITISKYGKPAAKLTGIAIQGKRELGFYPIKFKSNLAEPTSEDIIQLFADN